MDILEGLRKRFRITKRELIIGMVLGVIIGVVATIIATEKTGAEMEALTARYRSPLRTFGMSLKPMRGRYHETLICEIKVVKRRKESI